MISTYLVWFCGTGETQEQVQHLFEGIPNENCKIVPGWGTKEMCGARWSFTRWSEDRIQASGIDDDDAKKILSQKLFSESLADVKNLLAQKKLNKLIVGGFSRGSAFFLPFFLKHLCEDNTFPCQNLNKLAIVLMDPVTGSTHSGNKEDVTESTLSTLGILSKMKLLETLSSQVKNKVYIFSLIPGFDKRKENFRPDTSFLSALNALKTTKEGINDKIVSYTYRAGITHSVFSTYSKDKATNPKIKISLDLNGSSLNSNESSELQTDFSALLNADLDLMFTKQLITNLCFETNLYDAAPFNTQYLEAYQKTTSKVLACAKKINYDLGKNYWTGANNDNYVATEMRKLIQPSDDIEDLITLLREWHGVRELQQM